MCLDVLIALAIAISMDPNPDNIERDTELVSCLVWSRCFADEDELASMGQELPTCEMKQIIETPNP